MTEPTPTDIEHLEHAIALARTARERGDHPFGSVVVAPSGTVVGGMNSVVTDTDPTGHAETNAVRTAARMLGAEVLAQSTLYTSTEPCAMCTGAIYWAGIPRIVYALGEDELRDIVAAQGSSHTLAIPSREVLARGDRGVEVVGPVALEGAVAVHDGAWVEAAPDEAAEGAEG